MELEPVELISLAALLHDIGKIMQRSGLNIQNTYNKDEFSPIINDHSSYLHAAYTADFLDWFVKEFGINSPSADLNLVNIASYHHKDIDKPYHKIVRIADWLSSGFERTKQEESEDFIKAQLVSIFSSVFNADEYRYPLQEFKFDITPIKEGENTKEQYRQIYEKLVNDIVKLKNIDKFDIFYDSLNYLLEKYTWAVPSSAYKAKADISLYDHSRIAASIATALYKYYEQTGKICFKDDSENCFALIQGDFSGIQNFIFSKQGESNKFAAKILRARSFFVSLSTDLVAFHICKKLGLTKASIVMNAGGKFTILSHNAQNLKTVIDEILQEVNREFKALSYGQTRFEIAYEELSPKDFLLNETKDNNKTESAFLEKYKTLASKLETKKLRPQIDSYVFDYKIDKDKGICRICNQHPANKDKDKDKTPVCEVCDRMIDIGSKLVNSDFFAITTFTGIPIFADYKIKFLKDDDKEAYEILKKALLVFDIGYSNTFNNDELSFRGFAKSKISTYVPRFDQDPINIEAYKNIKKDIENLKKGDIKPFSAIAEDSKGSKFLGVLKADVDSLGYIFAKGFGDSPGISKVASLSRMLDFFFTGWLQHTIKTKYQSIYTVFSGGDDLFLIGPFDQIIDVAKDIHKHLKEYTKNDYFHLSCGIYFAKDKIPVYQMAREAEEALESSKRIKDNLDGLSQEEKILKSKNAITLFERTMKWDRFEKLMDIDFENLFKTEKTEGKKEEVSSSFIYKLFTYLDMMENTKALHSDSRRDLMWKPLFVYNVYRYFDKLDKSKRDDAIAFFLKNILDYFEKFKGDFKVALSNYVYRNSRNKNG
ncbi:MAG: type III-A CRISPR-associated protein Cas10/Csm1 [Desulfurella sp.]